jgi:cephalosporin hydroxylase
MTKQIDDHLEFKADCAREIADQGGDRELADLSREWTSKAAQFKYSYHFEWLGRPIIQHPQDMVGVQQLLWKVRPDLIIETGIARGGSLVFYASILELISLCGGNCDAKILGIDIDIRAHNKTAILDHPMASRISMLEGSSTDPSIISLVREAAQRHETVLLCLDSNHTHDHVVQELEAYAPMVSANSYCIVFDTIVEDVPSTSLSDRPWGKGNNPKTAVQVFLEKLADGDVRGADGKRLNFVIDKEIENQLLITVAPGGFLRRI